MDRVDLQAPLQRLIRIRVRAEHDRLAHVARPGELLLQHLRGVVLVEELGLEIETGGQAHVRVTRPRVTIDASVFASPVRVDRLLEADIRRIVGA